jgi:hypothetical protein
MNAESYRKLAAQFLAKAVQAPNTPAAAQYDGLARAYLRLAEQAEQNLRADVWGEFGPKPRLDSEA